MTDRVLLLGAGGMLATSIQNAVQRSAQNNHWTFLTEEDLDITDTPALKKTIRDLRPAIIINAAAYTNVRAAQQNQHACTAINTQAVANLAGLAAKHSIHLVHFSTDYIFSGDRNTPWTESDQPDPINVYGQSKLDGEKHITQSGASHLIVRSAWLFAPHGNNFISAIAKKLLAAQPVNIVADQIGSPTSADDLAQWLLVLLERKQTGLIHAVNSGLASWHDLAVHLAKALRIDHDIPSTTADQFDPLTPRPSFSVLDNSRLAQVLGTSPRHWSAALDEVASSIRRSTQ